MSTLIYNSVRGKSHIDQGIPNQDSIKVAHATIPNSTEKKKVTVIAVADGVGSHSRSDEGSAIAVKAAVKYIQKHIAEAEDPESLASIIHNAISATAKKVANLSFATEAGSTLTVAVVTDQWFSTVGVGDSFAVVEVSENFNNLAEAEVLAVQDGVLQPVNVSGMGSGRSADPNVDIYGNVDRRMTRKIQKSKNRDNKTVAKPGTQLLAVFPPQVGEFANLTQVLTTDEVLRSEITGYRKDLRSLAVCTDAFSSTMHGNVPVAGFWRNIFRRARNEELQIVSLVEFMVEQGRTVDDATLAVLVDKEASTNVDTDLKTAHPNAISLNALENIPTTHDDKDESLEVD